MIAATDLRSVIEALDAAAEPEEVFGLEDPHREYRRLARIVHPDVGGDDAAAFLRLDRLWLRAKMLIADGAYGKAREKTVTIRTRRHEYVTAGRVGQTEISDLFRCHYELGGGQAAATLKVARKPRDNDLVQAEAATLRRLHRDLDERFHPFLPEFVELVGFRASGGIVRRGNVLAALDDGFVSLERVAAVYTRGVDPRDMAWMWRRLLYLLGAVHRAGVVHGAVTPASVLIHPQKHGLVLADWEYAIPAGGRPRAVSRRHRGLYPPELAGLRLDAAADVYMGAKTMLFLLDSARPERIPRPMRAFFRACLLPEALRPSDAWELQGYFDEILERCYGPRRFRPFSLPNR